MFLYYSNDYNMNLLFAVGYDFNITNVLSLHFKTDIKRKKVGNCFQCKLSCIPLLSFVNNI